MCSFHSLWCERMNESPVPSGSYCLCECVCVWGYLGMYVQVALSSNLCESYVLYCCESVSAPVCDETLGPLSPLHTSLPERRTKISQLLFCCKITARINHKHLSALLCIFLLFFLFCLSLTTRVTQPKGFPYQYPQYTVYYISRGYHIAI